MDYDKLIETLETATKHMEAIPNKKDIDIHAFNQINEIKNAARVLADAAEFVVIVASQ